jgi:hypothetical protein
MAEDALKELYGGDLNERETMYLSEGDSNYVKVIREYGYLDM